MRIGRVNPNNSQCVLCIWSSEKVDSVQLTNFHGQLSKRTVKFDGLKIGRADQLRC